MYEGIVAREYEKNGEKKTAFNKVSIAFDNKNGDGFSAKLEVYPLPDKNGEIWIHFKKPKPKEALQEALKEVSDFDDETPF